MLHWKERTSQRTCLSVTWGNRGHHEVRLLELSFPAGLSCRGPAMGRTRQAQASTSTPQGSQLTAPASDCRATSSQFLLSVYTENLENVKTPLFILTSRKGAKASTPPPQKGYLKVLSAVMRSALECSNASVATAHKLAAGRVCRVILGYGGQEQTSPDVRR